MIARSAPIALLLALTACMPQGEFPSLAKRPIETTFNQPPAPPPAPTAPPDSAALAHVNAALKTARDSVGPFNTAIEQLRPAIASAAGAPEGSDRWIDGQVAASRIEPLLVPATAALADIEDELRKVMTTPGSPDRRAIEAAIAEASEIVARQAEAAAKLTERLDR